MSDQGLDAFHARARRNSRGGHAMRVSRSGFRTRVHCFQLEAACTRGPDVPAKRPQSQDIVQNP